jgi:hypothetical protein
MLACSFSIFFSIKVAIKSYQYKQTVFHNGTGCVPEKNSDTLQGIIMTSRNNWRTKILRLLAYWLSYRKEFYLKVPQPVGRLFQEVIRTSQPVVYFDKVWKLLKEHGLFGIGFLQGLLYFQLYWLNVFQIPVNGTRTVI